MALFRWRLQQLVAIHMRAHTLRRTHTRIRAGAACDEAVNDAVVEKDAAGAHHRHIFVVTPIQFFLSKNVAVNAVEQDGAGGMHIAATEHRYAHTNNHARTHASMHTRTQAELLDPSNTTRREEENELYYLLQAITIQAITV